MSGDVAKVRALLEAVSGVDRLWIPEIADHLGWDPAVVRGNLDAMVERGIVRVNPDHGYFRTRIGDRFLAGLGGDAS